MTNNWLSYKNCDKSLQYLYKNGLPSPDNLFIGAFDAYGNHIRVGLHTNELPNPLPDRWRNNQFNMAQIKLYCYVATIKNALFTSQQLALSPCQILIDFKNDYENNEKNMELFKNFCEKNKPILHLEVESIYISNVSGICKQ